MKTLLLRNRIRMCLFMFVLQACLLIPSVSAQNYSDGIRIAWDFNQQKFLNQGVYARVKLLGNGDLALVYSNGNNIYFKKRAKGSLVWGNSVVVSRDTESVYSYTNSELTELSDGTLLYSWNARPGADTGRPYTIMIKFSKDGGSTWEGEQTVYTAGVTFNEGCWEPVVLQLPTGELQLYFANEYNTAGSSQNLMMMRSFDKGATWRAPEIVSYRNNKRDGMPVPVCLKDEKGIAMAIEDNGLSGAFKPVIIHTSVEDNWRSGVVSGDSPSRWSALASSEQLSASVYAGAPYLIQLSTGETVLSCQSAEGRDKSSVMDYSIMQVYVGDESAHDFSRKSTPFPNLPATANALWSALCQLDDSTVMAVSSINGLSAKNGIWTVNGKILKPIESVEAKGNQKSWESNPSSLFIGAESPDNLTIKTMWDQDSLYFRFNVNDWKITVGEEGSPLWDTDGVELYLDMMKSGSNTLVSGLYKLLVNVDRKTMFNRSEGNKWQDWQPKIGFTVNRLSNIKYSIDLSIPWSEIGGMPEDHSFAVHFKMHDNNGKSSPVIHENLTGGNPDRPYTWMKCTLKKAGTSIGLVHKEKNSGRLLTTPVCLKRGERFQIYSPGTDLSGADVKIYNAVSGEMLCRQIISANPCLMSPLFFTGIALMVANLPSGEVLAEKVVVNEE